MTFRLQKTADADFFKRLAVITVPAILQLLLNSSRVLIDTLMIAQLGDNTVAAVGAAGKPFFVMLVMLLGLSGGTGILASQYWGEKNIEGVRKSIILSVLLSSFIVIPSFLLFRFAPHSVVKLAAKDSEVITMGREYLSIISFNLICQAVILPLYSGLRSINEAIKCTIFGVIGVIINITLNYLLIFGNFGFPELGLKGAAIATRTSILIEAVLLVSYLGFSGHILMPKINSFINIFNLADIKHFVKITLPVVVNGLVWAGGIYIYFIIYGNMGSRELAVMTVLSPLESFCVAFFGGIGIGAGVMLGHHLGRRDFQKAWRESWVFVVISFLTAIILAVCLFAIKGKLLHLFHKLDPETLIMAGEEYIIFLLLLLFKSINVVVIIGVLRSGGDTRFCLYLDAGCQWLVGIPLGFLGAFFWKLPLKWVFALVITEEFVKIFICLHRMYSRRWMKNLTSG